MKARLIAVIFFVFGQIAFAQNYTHLIIARNTGTYTLWDGKEINVFGFTQALSQNVNIPAATIYANEGDSVIIKLWNVSQGAPHTIHLHGLDVDQANDGVGHLSFDVGHMEFGYYRFKAPHPGTYLYHCHVESPVHVQAGMYGLIVIRPADGSKTTWTGGFPFHTDKSWTASEIDSTWHNDSVLNQGHDTMDLLHSVVIPKFSPQYFLVNGKSEFQLADSSIAIYAKRNEKTYLRLANLGFCANTYVFPSALNCFVVDSDGRPLPAPVDTDTIVLLPGERFGVILEAENEFADSVKVTYMNLNNYLDLNTQYIPVQIQGVLGFQEINGEDFEIYPNPASDILYIKNESLDGQFDLEMYDSNGRLMLSEKLNLEMASGLVGIKSLPAGVYVVAIKNRIKTVSQKLVVIK